MVKKILIVEDELVIRKHLVSTAAKINPDLHILETGSASEAFKMACEHNIYAFFIDIQINDYNGLELAKKIRSIEKYYFVPIVFITAVATKELDAFRQIHCYDYILKPFSQEDLNSMFKKILINYFKAEKVEPEKLCLEWRGYKQLISMNDILYIEYLMRRIIIHTNQEVIKYRHMSIGNFVKQLSKNFVQIHQSIYVNRDYILQVNISENYIALTKEEINLPIGRTFKKKIGGLLNEPI